MHRRTPRNGLGQQGSQVSCVDIFLEAFDLTFGRTAFAHGFRNHVEDRFMINPI